MEPVETKWLEWPTGTYLVHKNTLGEFIEVGEKLDPLCMGGRLVAYEHRPDMNQTYDSKDARDHAWARYTPRDGPDTLDYMHAWLIALPGAPARDIIEKALMIQTLGGNAYSTLDTLFEDLP